MPYTQEEIDEYKKHNVYVKVPWQEAIDVTGKPPIGTRWRDHNKGEDTDEHALSNGYASVVPTQYDLTAHHFISDLNTWKLNK